MVFSDGAKRAPGQGRRARDGLRRRRSRFLMGRVLTRGVGTDVEACDIFICSVALRREAGVLGRSRDGDGSRSTRVHVLRGIWLSSEGIYNSL